MVLINEELKAQGAKASSANNQTNFNQNAQANETQKGLISLPPALMQIIPWIPFALEAMTGQKIPQIGGTIGEIQASLQQLQFQISQVSTQQQRLYTRLESLEANASTQLTNLSQQLANTNKDFRLIAQETKRSLEFSQSRSEPARDYE